MAQDFMKALILMICEGEVDEQSILQWDWVPADRDYPKKLPRPSKNEPSGSQEDPQLEFAKLFTEECEHFDELSISCELLQRSCFGTLTDRNTRCAQLIVYFTLEKIMAIYGIVVDINIDEVLQGLSITSPEAWKSWVDKTRNSGSSSPTTWSTFVHKKVFGIYSNSKRAKPPIEGVEVDGNLTLERELKGADTTALSEEDREHRKKHGTIQSPMQVGQTARSQLNTHTYINVYVRHELEEEAKGILDDINDILFQRARALDPTDPNAALRDRQYQLFNTLISPEFIDRITAGKQVMKTETLQELAQCLGIHEKRLRAEWAYMKKWLLRFLRSRRGERLKARVLEVVNYDVIGDKRLEDPWETTYLPSAFEREGLTHEEQF